MFLVRNGRLQRLDYFQWIVDADFLHQQVCFMFFVRAGRLQWVDCNGAICVRVYACVYVLFGCA